MSSFPEIDPGVLAGGQPTEQDLAEIRQKGIRTVIDFRRPGEIATSNEEMARRQGMDYVNIPVDRANPTDDLVDRLDHAMTEKPGPFLLHCGTGIRAVTVYLLKEARHKGWTAEQTLNEAAKRGYDVSATEDLGGFVRRYLG